MPEWSLKKLDPPNYFALPEGIHPQITQMDTDWSFDRVNHLL